MGKASEPASTDPLDREDPSSPYDDWARVGEQVRREGGRVTRTPSRVSKDAFTSTTQNRATYLTTTELARELALWPEQVYRWCVAWFGPLPEDRKGRGTGYRIPLHYRLVARAWLQTTDPKLREQVRWALDDDPKSFVVVVGSHVSTHYTVDEARERMTKVLPLTQRNKEAAHVLYVGPIDQ